MNKENSAELRDSGYGIRLAIERSQVLMPSGVNENEMVDGLSKRVHYVICHGYK